MHHITVYIEFDNQIEAMQPDPPKHYLYDSIYDDRCISIMNKSVIVKYYVEILRDTTIISL